MRRLFFAASPTEGWHRRLAESVASALGPLPGRPQAAADWHVTLCFLGAVDEALLEPLCRQAARVESPAFELCFDKLAYWRRPRVLVASARETTTPAVARTLVHTLTSLSQALTIAPDPKPWAPHLTLARAVSPRALPGRLADESLSMPSVSWSVDSFHLLESRNVDGRRYQSLASWPLRAQH